MSDFGSVIQVSSNKGVSSSSLDEIFSSLEVYIEENEIVGFDGEPIIIKHETLDDNSVVIRITEYYFGGDENDDDLFETIQEEEQYLIDNLITHLDNKFPKYDFSGSIEQW